MTSLIFMLLLHFTAVWGSTGKLRDSNTVYGLPELTRDILERIKAATGHPIDTNRFMPLPSMTNYHVVEHQPSTRTNEYFKKSGNENLEKGHYNLKDKNQNFGVGKKHFFEIFEQEKDGNELVKHEYEDEGRKSEKYDEDKYFMKDHHKSGGGKKGGKFKKGRKRGKFHIEKGFRDIYHKDEEKKSDFFWNNKHEEGKWIEYGFKNRKHEKKQDRGDEGKQAKEKTEESSYEKKEDKCTKCKS